MKLLPTAILPIQHPYLINKYTQWYYDIIENAKTREVDGYVENHHIIPRCMNGTDDSFNLVKVTAREHFMLHVLLIRMVNDKKIISKLVYAAWQQSRSAKYHDVKITSRTYEILKRQLSESYTGRKRAPFSDKTRENMRLAHIGKKRPASQNVLNHIKRITDSKKGCKLTEEHKQKCSESLKGRKFTDEHKEKIRLSKIGKPCPPEVIAKIKETKRLNPCKNPMKGKKHSEKSIQNMRMAKVGKSNPRFYKQIKCITTGEIFESITRAAKHFNIPPSYISAVLIGDQKSTRGLVFQYINHSST